MEKTVSEAIGYRRSVRIFRDDLEIDSEKVRKCIENAVLAPTSSNLQLWEFYHVIEKDKLQKLTKACLNQNAAKTAQQMVVVVSRKDLWRKRAQSNVSFLQDAYGDKPVKEYSRREKFALMYYKKLIPTVYFDILGILGWIKYAAFNVVGLFKPVYRQVRQSDMRIFNPA